MIASAQDEFQLSHEFLAMMLGTTRPTVTVVAGTLQKAGLIEYRHGRIRILDRKSLRNSVVRMLRDRERTFRPPRFVASECSVA